MRSDGRTRLGLGGLLALALLAAVVTIAIWAARAGHTPLAGPVEIAWDRQTCAHCAMHVSDPAFAAQVHTDDGDVLVFDDPGCALAYVAAHPDGVHAIWFHHLREDRWLAAADAAFVPVVASPMGWGLGAVDIATPNGLSLATTRERVVANRRGDGQPRTRPEG